MFVSVQFGSFSARLSLRTGREGWGNGRREGREE